MNELNENDSIFIEKFLNSFQTLGGNESGLIDYNHFKLLCLKLFKEDTKEVFHCLEAENCIVANDLDFLKLCKIIINTKTAFNKTLSENKRILPSNSRINTHTFTRKKANIVTSTKAVKNSDPKKLFIHKINGTSYNLIEGCFSNKYMLDIVENTDVDILVKPISHSDGGQLLCPVEVLVLQYKDQSFVSCSTAINSEGFCTANATLKKGKYIILPMLLNWPTEGSCLVDDFFESLFELHEDRYFFESMFESNEDQLTFTSACNDILQAIFCSVDLDGDGFLSQLEFDLFAQYVMGEHAEEWSAKIEDKLSFSGFVEECKFALQTDPSKIVNMFQKMGVDDSFKQNNAQSFVLEIASTSSKSTLKPLPVSAYSSLAEKILKKITVEKGSSKKIKNMNDLILYTYKSPHRATMVIQNQAHSKITVQLDCSKSINCQSHKRNLNYSFEVPSRSSILGHHLFPSTMLQPWFIICSESLN